jgi:hypothetical protein
VGQEILGLQGLLEQEQLLVEQDLLEQPVRLT